MRCQMCLIEVTLAIWSNGIFDTWLLSDLAILKSEEDLMGLWHSERDPCDSFFDIVTAPFGAAAAPTASGKTHYSNNKAENRVRGSSAPSLKFAVRLFTNSCWKMKRLASTSCCNNVPGLLRSFWYSSWLSWSTMENRTRLFSFRTALFKSFIVKMCQWKNPQRC